jgi:hypothetical protein
MTHFDWSELKAHHKDLEQIFEVVMLPQWVVLWPLDEPYSPVKAPVPLTRQTAGVEDSPVLAPPPQRPKRVIQPDETTDDEGEADQEEEQQPSELTRSSSPSY